MLLANKQKQQDKLDARATLYEKRLRAQYTALDKDPGAWIDQMIQTGPWSTEPFTLDRGGPEKLAN